MRSVVPFFHLVGLGDEPGPVPERTLGHDLGTWLVERDGRVVTTDPEGELPEVYVNASVQAFDETIDVFGSWYESLDSEGPSSQVLEALRNVFDRIDPTALADGSHWWPLVIEQVETGTLSPASRHPRTVRGKVGRITFSRVPGNESQHAAGHTTQRSVNPGRRRAHSCACGRAWTRREAHDSHLTFGMSTRPTVGNFGRIKDLIPAAS